MKYPLFSISVLTLFLFVSCASTGQIEEPRDNRVPLDHKDFDQWRSISDRTLSRDGSLLVYSLNPQEGDGELVVRRFGSGSETRLERGRDFVLSYDARHLVYVIQPLHSDVRQARIDGERPSDIFEDTLAIYIPQTGSLETISRVSSFRLPEKSGTWLAYLLDRSPDDEETENDDEETEKNNDESTEDYDSATADDTTANESEQNDELFTENDLFLRNLETGEERVIHFVEEYHFSLHGERLVYRTEPADTLDAEPGLFVLDLRSNETTQISSGLENYRSVTMDSTGAQIAFLAQIPSDDDNAENGNDDSNNDSNSNNDSDSNNDSNGSGGSNGGNNDKDDDAPEYYGLYYWSAGMDDAIRIADETSDWLESGWMINRHSGPEFSHDGSRLLFGTVPEPMRRDRSVEKIDMAEVDIWHWQDDRLQPQQLVRLDNDRRRTYKAAWHIEPNTFVQIEDTDLENVSIGDRNNAGWGLGSQNRHYLHLTQWKGFPAFTDLYRVNISTGERIPFAERVKAALSFSPCGNWFAWYDFIDRNWFAARLDEDHVISLTDQLKVPFWNELHDTPTDPGPYGVEGWTEDGRHVIIRDRYDLWAFATDEPHNPVKLTGGYGRENGIVLRAFDTDPETRWFSTDTVWLSGTFDEDKSSAFYRTSFSEPGMPEQLWRGPWRAFNPEISADGNRWIVRKSTFRDYPDVYETNPNFSRFDRITEANPQQDNYLWGDVKLFGFRSLNGDELDGLLYTPDNFDPDREYPMIVYFYERTSNRKHWYRPPAPSASTITPAFYTSRGYIVAMPDIVYREGLPGRSAEDAVIGMTLHLLDLGFVDEDRIALQGQSWGGYQIAHIITRTDMFAAAMAGTPVVNMISAYGGIRWASGLNRQFQYERTQSRIGGTLWERPTLYIENSPIFFADRVNTPLLMMHNDADGAVPWYQGIEFFTALKRLERPVWMLNYNDEAHNLRERVNRKDLSRRMQQFFDHYLMDAPMPVWMKYGVPAIEKGLHQGFDLVE